MGFCILGALVGSRSFIELFVVKVFHEDLGAIFSLSMFACRSPSNFYDAFVVLCLTPWLLVLYNVSISKYFATLH